MQERWMREMGEVGRGGYGGGEEVKMEIVREGG